MTTWYRVPDGKIGSARRIEEEGHMMEWILGLLVLAIGGLLWVGWYGKD